MMQMRGRARCGSAGRGWTGGHRRATPEHGVGARRVRTPSLPSHHARAWSSRRWSARLDLFCSRTPSPAQHACSRASSPASPTATEPSAWPLLTAIASSSVFVLEASRPLQLARSPGARLRPDPRGQRRSRMAKDEDGQRRMEDDGHGWAWAQVGG